MWSKNAFSKQVICFCVSQLMQLQKMGVPLAPLPVHWVGLSVSICSQFKINIATHTHLQKIIASAGIQFNLNARGLKGTYKSPSRFTEIKCFILIIPQVLTSKDT